MYRHLLVPIDGTPLSSSTVEQAVMLAGSIAARITFLHVKADFAATEDGALLQAVDPTEFANLASGNARGLLAKAAASAQAARVTYQPLVMTSDHPAEAILEAAQSQGCDLIFMASHGRRGLKSVLVGSVTQKVLQKSTLPVLVASVEGNLPNDPQQQTVTIIRDEHRSLAAVIVGFKRVLSDSERSGQAPDIALLRGMLFYIEHFPERLHHPKEERHLFRQLRARTSECNVMLDRLESDHLSGGRQVAALRDLLSKLESAPSTGLVELQQAFSAFADSQMRHIEAEEKLILPAATRWLAPDDWAEAYAAFRENGDPHFDARTDASFAALFARIINLVADAGRKPSPPA